MMRGKASRTAEITAVFRAIESIRPDHARLFQDTYAAEFLRPSFKKILKNSFLSRFVLWLMIDRHFPGATDTIVSRIRLVDVCLKNQIEEGIEQSVILGAGYDARAYGFSKLEEMRVFEVDHPNTQRLKKVFLLSEIFLRPRSSVCILAE